MSDDRKDLPPAKSANFLEKAREALQVYLGMRGDALDRGVTVRDLVDSGIVSLRSNFGSGSTRNPISGPGANVGDPYEEDLTPPPTPSGFTVTAAISNLLVECAAATYSQGHGHAKSKLYGATWVSGALPVFANAVVITEFQGTASSHATNPSTTWHLWLTWVTVDGVESTVPAGGTNGVVARTGENVALLLDALTGEITSSELNTALSTRINLIDGSVGLFGSVDYRVKVETDARVLADGVLNSAIAAEALLRENDTTALSAVVESGEALRDGLAAALQSQVLTQATDAATLSAALSTEIADRATAVSAEALSRTNADIAEAVARVEADTIEAKARLDQEQVDAEALLRSILVANTEKLDAASEVAIAKNQMAERTDAGLLAEATSRLTLAAKLDTDITSTLALVTAESVARSTAISAEATQRNLLATQFRGDYTGSDPALLTSGLLYEERSTRVSEDQALAQQITLLSAGAGEQFDWKAIWYFDSGVESWTGNGTPTATSGYLRPADQVSGAYVESPVGINSNGSQYGQVRLRVRKVGTPTWAAKIYWRAAADSTWDVGRSFVLDAPTWDGNGIGLVTATPGWTVTVDRVRVDLSSAQTVTDYYELDWVAIGRPSPGASSSQLLDEQTARTSADSALTTSVTTLSAQVNNVTNGLPATNALILAEQITRADADTAESAARTTLAARVTTAESNITTNAAGIATESTARADADTAISGTVTTLSATVTDLSDDLVLTDASLVATQAALATSTSATVRDVTALQAGSEEIGEATLRAILEGQAIKDSYNGEVALARQELTTQIEIGVLAEATQRLSLTAVVNENAATLETEKTTRAAETGALSASITTLFSITDGNTAGLLQTQTTQTTADAALSAVANALSAKSDGNAASVLSAQTANATADASLASQIASLNTVTGATSASLQVEQVARSNDTASLAAQITSVSATAGTISGDLTETQAAIATDKGAYVADTKVLQAQAAEVDETTLRTLLEGQAIKDAYNGELALARQDLTTQIEIGVLAESQYRLALAAVVDGNVATLAQEMTTRATETAALSQSVTTLFADTGANSAALSSEQLARTTEDGSLAAQSASLVAVTGSNAAAIQTEQTVRTTDTTALAAQNSTLAVATGANAAAVQTEQLARATDDSAIAANVTVVTATAGTNSAALSSEQLARATDDSAIAANVAVVTATAGTNTASIATEQTTRASETGLLFAKYTVKIDVNGYVSGFGLASTANNAAPTSNFIVRSDYFSIASPSGPGITPATPFVAVTTPQTINGVSVPVGIYMDAAYIENGTITNTKIGNAAIDDAKIANLSAGKITTGTLDAARIGAESITAGQIDTRNLTIKDGAGNVIFSSGVPLSTSYAASGLINSNITIGGLGYIGALDATAGKSMVIPITGGGWTLGSNQSIVTIADGKVGTKALQITGGGYTHAGAYMPIDRAKTYRVRFWARPNSANTSGLLYFSLQQFTNDVGTTGPVNGGRSPYKPSGTNRATHNATYGGTDQWGEYSYTWSNADWQSGVTHVRPDFLDNYSGQAGWWQIQDFTMEEITEVVAAATTANYSNLTGTPSGAIANSNVTINADGSLTGAGGGSVSAAGINAVQTSLANAPAGILNNFTEGSTLYIPRPAVGAASYNGSPTTGSLRIKLPQSMINTMLRFTVEIYEYASNASSTYEVGGYTSDSGSWANTFARYIGPPGNVRTVRFGYVTGGTVYAAIWFGDSSTNWYYPKIRVVNFMAGYSNYAESQWATGWEVSILGSSATNVSSTITTPVAGGAFSGLDQITLGNVSTYIASAAIDTAYITNGAITNAKIGGLAVGTANIAALAVTNAKINDMNVSKLTAGSLAVSQYLQSSNYSSGFTGFRINANGSAEFNGVVISRPQLVASGTVLVGTTLYHSSYGSPSAAVSDIDTGVVVPAYWTSDANNTYVAAASLGNFGEVSYSYFSFDGYPSFDSRVTDLRHRWRWDASSTLLLNISVTMIFPAGAYNATLNSGVKWGIYKVT